MSQAQPPLRIGLLGASRIAPKAVIDPAAHLSDKVSVTAVAASDANRARDYATTHGIPNAFGSYESLIDDPRVDLVYNALAPARHADLCIAAMEAGKDVFCEKPIAMNAEEAQAMVDAAERTGRRLIEAFHYRYHPLFQWILDQCRADVLGPLTAIQGRFCVSIPYRDGELRHDARMGGGGLMDLGCYVMHWLRTIAGAEPVIEQAKAWQGHAEDVDVWLAADMDLGGVKGRLECAMDYQGDRAIDLVVEGRNGRLTVDNPMAPHTGHSARLELAGKPARVATIGGMTSYDHQLAAVVAGLSDGSPLPTEGRDSVNNMAAIDAAYRAAGMAPRGMI